MLARLHRLDITRLAADYSAAVRDGMTADQLAKVRRGDAVPADYTDNAESMAEAVALQLPDYSSLADYAAEMFEADRRAMAAGWHLSRILIAGEFSGTVRDAFRARGHDAVSCDIIETEAPHGPHLLGDMRGYFGDGWHMMIAHPPCTYIAACQLWRCQPKHDPTREREAKRLEALELVRDIGAAPIARICVENPKSCIGTAGVLPGFDSQMVQPNRYGHDHSKQTYLWRKGLPPLTDDPADHVAPRLVMYGGKMRERWANQSPCGADAMGPSADRGHKRSRFFSGIAAAMAEQWGGILAPRTQDGPPAQLALFA
jgi:hypothetical protein